MSKGIEERCVDCAEEGVEREEGQGVGWSLDECVSLERSPFIPAVVAILVLL